MLFFERYLQKHSVYDKLILHKPNPNLFMSVVIPCYNEPDIIRSLESLHKCDSTRFPVEVIIVINHSSSVHKDIAAFNENTYRELTKWAEQHNSPNLRYFILKAFDLPDKDAGVGLARKIGMDEAIRRFIEAGNPDGIIAGFDADCVCSASYLREIEDGFKERGLKGASVYFEHPLSGEMFSESVFRSVEQYELHLRYYKNALKWTGFPFAFYTVGSSFAVRADVYCRQGGMNKKRAGEDFYFLSKVIPLGKFSEINSACVYPSPRPSDRVPFGTGAAVRKMLISNEQHFYTYPFELFVLLKRLFGDLEMMYNKGDYNFPGNVLGDFCRSVSFGEQLNEIRSNTATFSSFSKRFFMVFNSFKVLKFLNFATGSGYSLNSLEAECSKLLDALKKPAGDINLLKILRETDRE